MAPSSAIGPGNAPPPFGRSADIRRRLAPESLDLGGELPR
jgi:hypothetical protein